MISFIKISTVFCLSLLSNSYSIGNRKMYDKLNTSTTYAIEYEFDNKDLINWHSDFSISIISFSGIRYDPKI